jgi:hypothetical protein
VLCDEESKIREIGEVWVIHFSAVVVRPDILLDCSPKNPRTLGFLGGNTQRKIGSIALTSAWKRLEVRHFFASNAVEAGVDFRTVAG